MRERSRAQLALETTEPMSFGYGFISGLLSALLGIAGFGAVLCLHFPQYLTHVELRQLYSLPYLRAIIHVALVASFLCGSASAVLRANKTLPLIGIGLTLAAALLGGSRFQSRERSAVAHGSGSISSSSTFFCIPQCSFHSNGSLPCAQVSRCSGVSGSWM